MRENYYEMAKKITRDEFSKKYARGDYKIAFGRIFEIEKDAQQKDEERNAEIIGKVLMKISDWYNENPYYLSAADIATKTITVYLEEVNND